MNKLDQYAKVLWGYMRMKSELKKSDIIIVLTSIDDRVASYAADLYLKGYADHFLISGGFPGSDNLLKTNWKSSEADHFAEIAVNLGVPKQEIIIEDQSSNTGENIRFSQKILNKNNLSPKSIILVQKPYMERRTYATFKKQWQGSVETIMTSPDISYEDYFNNANPKEKVINIMVGDLQRIIEYPKLGFQIEQDVPVHILEAWKELVNMGYTEHLVKNK